MKNILYFLLFAFMVEGVKAQVSFAFSPSHPQPGQTVTVKVTGNTPWVYVGLQAIGPNTVNGSWGGVVTNANGTYTWTWTLQGLKESNYLIRFTSDNNTKIQGTTSLLVSPPVNISFAFNPTHPVAGQSVTVFVTGNSPWVYVGLQAIGPNTSNASWGGVVNNNNGTWTWAWTLQNLIQGSYSIRFTSDNGTILRGSSTLIVGHDVQSISDAWFQFTPPNPYPGQKIQVKVTSRTAHTYIALNVNRNGITIPATDAGYIPNDDYYSEPTHTWVYNLPALEAGNHAINFTANGTTISQTVLPVQHRSLPAIVNAPFGFSGHFWWTNNNCSQVPNRIQRFIDEYAALGAKTIRIGIDWGKVEYIQGTRNYSDFDQLLTSFNNAGITVIALFYTAPPWATADGAAWNPEKKLNRNAVNSMRATAQDMAKRYPFIHHWEFWNEPAFQYPMAMGNEFAFWFRNFRDAIKSVRSADKVSFGTILSFNTSPHTNSFIKNVLSALQGYQPDAISLHPYNASSINIQQITQIHAQVPHIPLWITEYGWGAQTEADQAANLKNAITWMRAQQYIEFSTMHMLHDWNYHNETYCNFADDYPIDKESYFGLVTPPFYQGLAYHRKLAWYTFRDLAQGPTCTIPTNLNTVNITSSSAQIYWTGSTSATQYYIAYKPSAGTDGWIYKAASATTNTLTSLKSNTRYVFVVAALCNGVWTSYSTNGYFDTKPAPFAVPSKEDSKSLIISPNPAQVGEGCMLNYHLENEATVQVVIRNMHGKIVKQTDLMIQQPGEYHTKLETRGLSNGLYLLHLYLSNGQVRSSRLMLK